MSDTYYINLIVPERVAIKRILNRALENPEAARPDDLDEETIAKRIEKYHANLSGLLKGYDETGEIITIDFIDEDEPATSVHTRALTKLGGKLKALPSVAA